MMCPSYSFVIFSVSLRDTSVSFTSTCSEARRMILRSVSSGAKSSAKAGVGIIIFAIPPRLPRVMAMGAISMLSPMAKSMS